MPALDQVHRHIEDNFEQHLERTKTFVRQPSISCL